MKALNPFILALVLLLLPVFSQAVQYEVNGVGDTIEENVLAHVIGLEIDCVALLSPVSRQQQEFKEQVKTALQPFGYFNAEVNIESNNQDTCDPVQLNINPGVRTTVGSVKITVIGSNDQDFVEVQNQYPINAGDPLRQTTYQNLKRKWLELANEKLYLDAKFESEKLVVSADENQAAIELIFNTGPRYPVSQVNIDFTGGDLKPQLIQKLITIKPHHYTTQTEMYQLRQKLSGQGYFATVILSLNESQKNAQGVPLDVTLTPAPKYDYSAGVGFSTDLGIKTSFKYNNHRINSRGHQLVSHLDLSQIRNEFGVTYKVPSALKPARKWYNIQLAYRDETIDNIDSQTSKLGFSQTRINDNQWQNINFIDILHEAFDTGVDQGEALLLVPGVSWTLRQADNFSRPSRGYQIQMELKGASEALLSDASFVQATLAGKFIHRLGDSNRLLYRAQVGGTASSDFDQLPTTYRFFAGGDQTIRGYDFQSISPINDSGDLAGGKHMVIGSVEFEHQFAEQWAWAVFTDAGDAYNDSIDLKHSAGIGARWFSPIGPIRLDLGVPLNKDENDFRIHVTIGPDL